MDLSNLSLLDLIGLLHQVEFEMTKRTWWVGLLLAFVIFFSGMLYYGRNR